jgi:hypothetical protein
MTPTRQRGKPVFDPSSLDADLDDLWPAAPAARRPVTLTPPPDPAPDPPPGPPSAPTSAAQVAAVQPTQPAGPPPRNLAAPSAAAPSGERTAHPRPTTPAPAVTSPVKARTRPPEVLLSSEVYDELYRTQMAEKKTRRGLARTMGVIVLDAIEAHAPRLATTWSNQQFAVGEGQLFERRSSNAVPPRRRHVIAPRTVVLSGVTAANGQRLDDLVQAWGAGTRSALVEQALRYQFGLIPD